MKINKQSGLPLQIYIPNLQTTQPFEMEFYTNPTTPKNLNITVSFDGSTYTNCKPWEKGVYLYTDKKLPNNGALLCRATYYVPCPMVSEGLQKVVIDKIDTGITLVSEGGSYFDPISDPSKLQIPSFNDQTCSHTPIFMTYYPGAEKGEKSDISIDRSILTEQIVPGEFAAGCNGTRKQVYGRLLKLTTVVAIYTGNGYVHWPAALVADSIIESSGVAKMPDSNGKFRIVAVASGSTSTYGMLCIHRSPDDKLYTFGFDNINTSHVGRPLELSIFVKYTK